MESVGIKNKKILVTGGTGFIGSHLVLELLKKGADVIVPYRTIHPHSLFALENLQDKVLLKNLDIRDKEKVYNLIKSTKIEFIFHLAAQTLVTRAYQDPIETLETNIMGTSYILEAMRANNSVEGIIVASSDKAYGKTQKPYNEEFPLKGDHPYDVSKSSTDLISKTYNTTYNLPVVITRFGNVYGEGDLHYDRIIPGICLALKNNSEFKIRSDGTFVRDYLYVNDVVSGYLFLYGLFKNIKGQAFNFSSDDTLSVLEIVNLFKDTLKYDLFYSVENSAKNEIPYQHLDDTKIRNLGWKTEHKMESVLTKVIDWYKKYAQA